MTITIKFSDNIRHGYGSFEEILKLDNYNDIVYIACYANYLYNLPKLPDSLKDLSFLPAISYTTAGFI